MVNLQKAEFVLSAVSPKNFIQDGRPQVAFAGRSNVGKSSVINRLLGRKNLAYVGSSPGKTTQINYFQVDRRAYLVDLPGYGYAKVSRAEKERWGRLMERYFQDEGSLITTGVLIVDIRHKPTADDLTMHTWFRESGCPEIIVANKLDKLKRSRLQTALAIAGLELSPEVYTARAWVTAGAVGICAVPMAFLMPLLSPVLVGLAVALWFSTYYAAFDFVRKRRKLIEAEIPRFALSIGQNLENDRDVLKMLTSYRRVAGRDFAAELDQTIADMKTGNYENALLRFETRIGSPMLSDVVRGLIGVLRGDDQRMYFKMICFDMRQIEQNNLKKEAAKRPRKIQRYSMMMLICIMIIYLVVLCTEVINSLGVFFG